MFDMIYRFDPEGRRTSTPPMDFAAGVRRLEDGNRAFVEMFSAPAGGLPRVVPIDADALGMPMPDGSPPNQTPFAAVLGCADARVPVEMIFDQACNDLFVVRVAGNVLGSECLGSLDFAVSNLNTSLRVIVVLGHTGCGAIAAAVDAFREPTRYLQFASSHPLRAVVDRSFVAVRAAHQALVRVHGQQVEEHPRYRRALIEAAVPLNAAMTAAAVKYEFMGRLSTTLGVVYGVYDLVSRRVHIPLESDPNLGVQLAPPPADDTGFENLGLLIAASQSVRDLVR
ncbi:MAG TPA: carbonic anhydrase [Fimbriiglobus sp.]|jgi:carbonic anhydrase